MRLKNIFYLFHISTAQTWSAFFFEKTPYLETFWIEFENIPFCFYCIWSSRQWQWLYKINVRILTKKSFATKYSHVPCHHGFYSECFKFATMLPFCCQLLKNKKWKYDHFFYNNIIIIFYFICTIKRPLGLCSWLASKLIHVMEYFTIHFCAF